MPSAHAPLVFVILALAALLTAFYTMRQITLTFLGEPRTKAAEHAHEIKLDDDPAAGRPGGLCRRRSAGWASPKTSRSSAGCCPTGSMSLWAARCWSIPRRWPFSYRPAADFAGGLAGRAVPGLAGLPRISKPAQRTRWRNRWAPGLSAAEKQILLRRVLRQGLCPPGLLAVGDLHLASGWTASVIDGILHWVARIAGDHRQLPAQCHR